MVLFRLSFLLILAACPFQLSGKENTASKKVKALYSSIEPDSALQHLAFYELYEDTAEGQAALEKALNLLAGKRLSLKHSKEPFYLPPKAVNAIVTLVNPGKPESLRPLEDREINLIDQLGADLHNRELKGRGAKTEKEVIALSPDEVDLARGLLLSQMDPDENTWKLIRTYEAVLDLMAMQIRARLHRQFTPEEAVKELNRYIFEEQKFRFPPMSVHLKDIETYSFLPSVIESRRGVCLGVSILYLCLGQRLGVPLEIITPPGHIYVRYNDGNRHINIETTARGIHLEDEHYLNINTRALQKANIKETVGMTHYNKASGFLTQGQYQQALEAYKKALPYMPEDPRLRELMAYCYLNIGDKKHGFELLRKSTTEDPYIVAADRLAEDLLSGNTDAEAIHAVFVRADETRESVLNKYSALKRAVEKYPKFRSAWSELGITLLQMHREREALETLEHYHTLDPENPMIEYCLTILNAQRLDFNRSWEHLRNVETITGKKHHFPKVLKELSLGLALQSPEIKFRN